MSKLACFAVLVAALLSLLAVVSSTAGAVTWDNSGNTDFTATAGPWTLTSTGIPLACGGWDIAGKTTTPLAGVGVPLIDITAKSTDCTLSGQPYFYDCGSTFTANAQIGAVTTGVLDITCSVYIAGVRICHVEGAVSSTYTNPSGAVAGLLATSTATNLRTTNGVANCPLGSGDVTHVGALSFRVTSGAGGSGTLGPVIVGTP